MQTLLTILLVLAMGATVVALVRGIVLFLKSSGERARAGELYENGQRQNQMMMARVVFQGMAVLLVVVILILRR